MTYYTGLDVSLRSVSVCIIDDTGAVCHETKIAAELDQSSPSCGIQFYTELGEYVSMSATKAGFLLGACKPT
jgi:hypothetical protein